MSHIEYSDYETVNARCDVCNSDVVLNRIDDIGEPGPYSGREVVCPECGRPFWICGDTANDDYQFFIFGADEHMRTKRYGEAAISLARA